MKDIYNKEISIILKNFIILVILFFGTIKPISEKYYEVSVEGSYAPITGILISDTPNKVKLIEEVYPDVKIVEIEKKNITRITEPSNIKIELIPFCENNEKNICATIANENKEKKNHKIIIKLDISKEIPKGFFNKNDKIMIKMYNFKNKEYDIIKEVKYLEKKDNKFNENIIYFENNDLIIELNKSYSYEDWIIVSIKK